MDALIFFLEFKLGFTLQNNMGIGRRVEGMYADFEPNAGDIVGFTFQSKKIQPLSKKKSYKNAPNQNSTY